MAKNSDKAAANTTPRHFAVIGAGMAGVACARTLLQAGHQVSLFEKSHSVGGRMATRSSPSGSFDHGSQYFTVRDARFAKALATTPGLCKPWSANAVRVLDAQGRVAEAALPNPEPHWVPTPGMDSLLRNWAQPLVAQATVRLQCQVTQIERDALNKQRWQLRSMGVEGAQHVHSGFDAVLLALPCGMAQELIANSSACAAALRSFERPLAKVEVAPCWTLMAAFAQAGQPGLAHLGPQWNAARSNHHRVAWLARESSKPGRGSIERWTVQASIAWSHEHLDDEPARVEAKLLKAFAEITGIRATPNYTAVRRWRHAQTTKPLGQSHLWNSKAGLGLCGDWCLGHRVEDAFISGLELALAVL